MIALQRMDGGLEIRLLAELILAAAIVFGFSGFFRRMAGRVRDAMLPIRIVRTVSAGARVRGGGNSGDDCSNTKRPNLTIQLNTKTLPCSCTGYTL